jgi:hypothetical protein
MVVAIFKVLPRFGPFRPLAFEPLSPDAERLFMDSFAASMSRYAAALDDLRAGPLTLRDTDLDTGEPLQPGRNPLADETLADVASRLSTQTR